MKNYSEDDKQTVSYSRLPKAKSDAMCPAGRPGRCEKIASYPGKTGIGCK